MRQDRLIQLVSIGLMLVCLTAVGVLAPTIRTTRDELQLTINTADRKAVAPHIQLAMAALGPFRGLAIDILWHRANQLQQDGKYYEAQTLAEWITVLQPRFPQVWAFQAWNMAYNISVATHTPQERWEWVNKGVDLLRDDGIPNNPQSLRLYRELAWIFFHKISGKTDAMHWYYKSALAGEIQEFMPPMTIDVGPELAARRFSLIANAPDTVAELRAASPDVPRFEKALQALDDPIAIDDPALARMIGRILMFQGSIQGFVTGLTDDRLPPGSNPDVWRLLNDDRHREAMFHYVMPFLQKRIFQKEYNMDVTVMHDMMKEYGPLDWRHSSAHAAYWAHLGLKKFEGRRYRDKKADELNTERIFSGAIQDLFAQGRIDYDPFSQQADLISDPRFVPAYEKIVRDARAKIASEEGMGSVGGGASSDAFDQAEENFLIRAVTVSYLYGDMKQAERCLRRLQDEYYPKVPHRPERWRYTPEQTVVGMVITELDTTADTVDGTRQFCDAMLRAGFRQGLYKDRMDTFRRFHDLAKFQYDRRQKKAAEGRKTAVAIKSIALPPWEDLVASSYIQFMTSEGVPVVQRSIVWHRTPMWICERSFGRLRAAFTRDANNAGLDVNRLFPVPPGFKEAEAKRLAEEEAKEKSLEGMAESLEKK